ncbi:MAG: hypothetical protein NTX64_01630 [Elusimicrobia bacterium]|nr:hypothetical protein [Elusimicrobiota bacterium]
MSHIFLDTRAGRLALYLHGDLQFDREDERLYHEPLALAPAALAARRAPGKPLRVLILGGGDGLALRQTLRVPAVAEVHLVERDPGVLDLGRGKLAALNAGAFADPRARITLGDARDFLPRARGFDALIYDLTYPSDQGGASLFTVDRFSQARRALNEQGILALNAVSPEKTPEAYACIGASLSAAGLAPLPYVCSLPSFEREGYGRWGFFLASRRPIEAEELAGLPLPLEGTLLPQAFGRLRVGPNLKDELLYHVYNGEPLGWSPPFAPARFKPLAVPVPRLTAAQGFSRWLKAPRGRRSVESLLACLPFSRRERTRQALAEWGCHAELIFRELDLKAFADATLRRASELPRAWVKELRRFRTRLEEGMPDMRELLEQAWRVMAVILLVLLLANLFFPDNLYAKGFSSHYSGGGGSGSISFNFTSDRWSSRPYHGYWGHRPRGSVYDSRGNSYKPHRFAFTDPDKKKRTAASLLALSPELQLLDYGGVSYATGSPGFSAVLAPNLLSVYDAQGGPVMTLLPPASLINDAQGKVLAQRPLIEKAMSDHQAWLDWTNIGSLVGVKTDAEMDELKSVNAALLKAEASWRELPRLPLPAVPAGWQEIFAGICIEPGAPVSAPRLALITTDGSIRLRSTAPPRGGLTEEDRFIFSLLVGRFSKNHDESLKAVLAEWTNQHAAALGLTGSWGRP